MSVYLDLEAAVADEDGVEDGADFSSEEEDNPLYRKRKKSTSRRLLSDIESDSDISGKT